MIRLAYPWALLLLGSIPVILILYSLRPRRRRVLLSTTSLWREALREQQRGLGLQKLLRDLSLVLLLLTALALCLGLAGPQWLTRVAEKGDAVLLLDVSASMKARAGGFTRFDEARRRAIELIDRLPRGGRMLIMTSGRYPVLRSAFESDRETLRRVLDRLQPTDEAGRPREALTLALSLLRNRERDRVYFLTDGAFDRGWDLDFEAAHIDYLPVGGAGRNVAITRFDLRREVGAEDRFQLFLTLRNYTDTAVRVPVTARLEPQALLEQVVDLPAGGEERLLLAYRGVPVGPAHAWIEFDDDLAADNHAYAVLGEEEDLRVLLFTKGNFYLESVLGALPNVALTKLNELWPESFPRQAQLHDVVIFDGMAAPSLSAGNFLLINTVAPGLPFAAVGEVAYPDIEGSSDSPLLEHVDLTGVKIDQATRIATDPGTAGLHLLFWSGQTELALTLLQENVRLVYLGFDLARSNLPLQAAFPVFFSQSLAWLSPRRGRFAATQLAAGETYSIALSANQEQLVVRTPSKQRLRYQVSGSPFLFDATSQAGIYTYTAGKSRKSFAMNLTDERESDINPRPAPQRSGAPPVRLGERSQMAQALWPYLAGAGLVFLMGEWCLWCRRGGNA